MSVVSEIETWLSDSGVGNGSVVGDDRGRPELPGVDRDERGGTVGRRRRQLVRGDGERPADERPGPAPAAARRDRRQADDQLRDRRCHRRLPTAVRPRRQDLPATRRPLR